MIENIMTNIIASIIASIIVAFIILVVNLIRKKYSLFIRGRLSWLSPGSFLPILILWVLINGVIAWFATVHAQSFILMISVFFVSSSLTLLLLWRELHQIRVLGIRSADRQITKGINYRDALKLCKKELRFLGLGADKLTRETEFEHALRRCSPNRPIQLLLCKPTDDNLSEAAKRAGKDRDEYKNIVQNSLRKIACLKLRRSLNIEVRLYILKTPIFRLMFINDSICLLSYYVFGEGDGSQLPQLHIMKAPPNQRDINSFYYPLERYFNQLWESSDIWDFQEYLQQK